MNLQDLTTKNDLLQMKNEILKELKDFLKPDSPQKSWLTTKDVMDMFGIKSVNTLQNLKQKGLVYKKLGGKCVYHYPDLLKFLDLKKEVTNL